jgi:hypothetical protein
MLLHAVDVASVDENGLFGKTALPGGKPHHPAIYVCHALQANEYSSLRGCHL